MKRSTRIISAIIALLFVLGVVFTIIITVSYAMPKSEIGGAAYAVTDTTMSVSSADFEGPLVQERIDFSQCY